MYRGVIIGKTGKTAVLPKYSETLTLSQQEGVVHTQNMIGPLMWERARFDHCLVLLTWHNYLATSVLIITG